MSGDERAYTFRLSDLPKLDLQVDKGRLHRVENTITGTPTVISRDSPEKQVEALTLCFSRETLSIAQHLGLTNDEKIDVVIVIQALQRFIDGHLNETVEHRNFHCRVQQPGESFDDSLISLRELAKTCKFCSDNYTERSIRDQIIKGIRDGDTVEELLQENNLTLATTITKCRSKEAAKKNRLDMATSELEVVAALRRPHQPVHHTSPATCPGCGSETHRGGHQYSRNEHSRDHSTTTKYKLTS